MKELHEIMEKLYEKEKKMPRKKILGSIHAAAEDFIRQKKHKLKKVNRPVFA